MCGLVRLVTSEAIPETRSRPNQGTRESAAVALKMGFIGVFGGTLLALLFDAVAIQVKALKYPKDEAIMTVLLSALVLGLLLFFVSGGLFVLKHCAVRMGLRMNGSAPLDYVSFLAFAKDRLLLRQVGGSYVFTHRLLREYLASLSFPAEAAGPDSKVNVTAVGR